MAIKLIVKELEKDAKRILRECVDERTYEHDTKNLYDSYGYGIYVEGSLTRSGFLSTSPQASKGKKWYGTEVIQQKFVEGFLFFNRIIEKQKIIRNLRRTLVGFL